ncbi:MAG: hypothetical protein V8R29_01905 [Eggerthellaceae bacterium]
MALPEVAIPLGVPVHVTPMPFATRLSAKAVQKLRDGNEAVYNGKVTLTEYVRQLPDRGASAVLGN